MIHSLSIQKPSFVFGGCAVQSQEQGWQTVIEDSSDFGFPVTRRRKWTHMRHKVKSGPLRMPLNTFTKLFYRTSNITFMHLFCATKDILQNELAVACQRNDVKYQAPITLDQPHSFERCLTVDELCNLEMYRCHWPGRAWSLNQSVGRGFEATSSEKGRLQAVIRNCHYIWADNNPHFESHVQQGPGKPLPPNIDMQTGKPIGGTIVEQHYQLQRSDDATKPAGRWLTSEECLLSQGFPMPGMLDYEETSWSVDRTTRGILLKFNSNSLS